MLTCRRAYATCGVAAIGINIYDYVLCLGREHDYVWQSGKSKTSRLVYLYISCSVIGWVTFSLLFLGFLGPAGRSKRVGGVALILGLVPLIVNVSTVTSHQEKPANLPPPQNCVDQNPGSAALDVTLSTQVVVAVARTATILADLLAIVVTWRATRSSRQVLRASFQQPSLHYVMWKNATCTPGTVAHTIDNVHVHSTLLLANLLDLILVTLSITVPGNQGSDVILLINPLNSILSCRFLLDLYETNARLERGGSSLSQSHLNLSLHFTGLEGADALDSSPFLHSFAGPILHTFPEGDAEGSAVDDGRSEIAVEPVRTLAGPSSSATAA
ncbi:hypothetical protein C2E23DRAFT_859489 [Lenzites betulinus]|nr:hypothetical protein C2E23DRAFT_859489 [Lenzites betulinus]